MQCDEKNEPKRVIYRWLITDGHIRVEVNSELALVSCASRLRHKGT